MTKNQKIWFAVFLAMFLVPEILLGAVRYVIFKMVFSFTASDIFTSSVFQSLNNNLITFVIITIEFVGLIGLLVDFYKINFRIKLIKLILLAILVLLVCATALTLATGFQLLSNSPQIG